MSLRPYVAELNNNDCPLKCKSTYTVWAKNTGAARRKLREETGLEVIEVAPLGNGLRRHWRAG